MEPANNLFIKTLPNSWQDKDGILLHASFQLLSSFVEEEFNNGIIDWDADNDMTQAKKEILDLYNWWQERSKLEMADRLDPIWDKGQYEKDNQMLKRLIDVGRHLWS